MTENERELLNALEHGQALSSKDYIYYLRSKRHYPESHDNNE